MEVFDMIMELGRLVYYVEVKEVEENKLEQYKYAN